MALLYDPSLKYLIAKAGFYAIGYYSASSSVSANSVEGASFAATIYSGTQPTAEALTANWTSTYNSTKPAFLLHFENMAWARKASDTSIAITKFPAPKAAVNTGTATWAVIWVSNTSQSSMASSIPTNDYVVVPVSTIGGNGIIKLATTDIIAGSSYSIADGVLSFDVSI